MKILLIEPFFTGSHKKWAEGFAKNSRHIVEILSLPGRYWKWRMYGGAVTLAHQFMAMDFRPDLILATDMLDLTTFLALAKEKITQIPIAIYFHENQITYPWSPKDADVKLQRNNQYGFLNFTSALAADRVFFNSNFHKKAFLEALPKFLKQFPDFQNLDSIKKITSKSEVLYLGMDLRKLEKFKIETKNETPILLWNHRWEYDKDPELFFNTLFKIAEKGIDFQLVVLGESYKSQPPIFNLAKEKLADKILHFGYANTFEEYAKWLWRADILPVTSNQDFFGGSVVEAIYANCFPILPNRLAFPEHLPESFRNDCLFDTDADFYEKLKKVILRFKNIDLQNLSAFVEKYDWKKLIVTYDEKL